MNATPRRFTWLFVAMLPLFASAKIAPRDRPVTPPDPRNSTRAHVGEVTDLRLDAPKATLTWNPAAAATEYEVLVSEDAAFTQNVEFLGMAIPGTTFSDGFVPPPGKVRHYLVRGLDAGDAGSWGFASDGVERLTLDSDGDGVADVVDNCLVLPNGVQEDMDEDDVGDECDNCPVIPNADQADSNGDGGGDACQPPAEIPFFGTNFEPDPGIAPELLDPDLPHPLMPGVVHPVMQLSAALMGGMREELQQAGAVLHEAVGFNVFLISILQSDLQQLEQLPFVRSVFPVPASYRVGVPSECDPLEYGTWSDPAPTLAPAARSGHVLTHAPDRDRIVLFGGDTDPGAGTTLLQDTWEWDGGQWLQIAPTDPPSPRSEHAMAWDDARGEMILFGGLADDAAGGAVLDVDDTWSWNGTDWMLELSPVAPSPRRSHALAYDYVRRQVVLFGGTDASGALLADTWLWDGATWAEVATPAGGPPGRFDHAVAWDAASRRVILFGGNDGQQVLGDTWEWDGEAWTALDPSSSPGPRAGHAMASRERSCGVILHGGDDGGAGSDPLADSWFFDGTSWASTNTPLATESLTQHALAYRGAARRGIAFGGLGPVSPSARTWSFEPSTVHDVAFHRDVPVAVADSILTAHGATVLVPGVTIVGGPAVNTWRAAIPDSQVAALAAEEPVIQTQMGSIPMTHNDGSAQALGVDLARLAPFCGTGCSGAGVVLSEWDGGWAAGDALAPPSLIGGAAHAGLTGRITVRDTIPLDSDLPPEPQGCTGMIDCDVCNYINHATHVAGTMLGDGTGSPPMLGMSPAATAISYNWPKSPAELTCEMYDASFWFSARAGNNSWGYYSPNVMGLYNYWSQTYDTVIRDDPEHAAFFSGGNDQLTRLSLGLGSFPFPPIYGAPSCTLPPQGAVGPPMIAIPPPLVSERFYTLPYGSGQTGKNSIVIGAINSGAPSAPGSYGRMTTYSSWGPTQDGRIKPDLVTAGSEDNQRDCLGFCPSGPPVSPDPDPQISSTVCDTAVNGACTSISSNYLPSFGTSMAAPAATGSSALLFEQQSLLGLVPDDVALDSDSLKALLVHTAIDLPVHFPLGGPFMELQDCDGDSVMDDCWPVPGVVPGAVQDGPDYVHGWGLIDVDAALSKLGVGNAAVTLRPSSCPMGKPYASAPLNSSLPLGGDPAAIGINGCGTTSIWDWVAYLTVPPATTQLKVTIAWDDLESMPPVGPSAIPLLNNDLRLMLTPVTGIGGSSTGPHHYTWFLDPRCPYLQAAPVVTTAYGINADFRNNVEQVVVPAPAPGTWRIIVQSDGLSTLTQDFAILISMPPSVP